MSPQGQLPPASDDNLASWDGAAGTRSVRSPQEVETPTRTESPPELPRTDPGAHPVKRRPVARIELANRVARTASVASAASKYSRGARTDAAVEKLFSPKPEYPAEALAARLTGRVVLRAKVDADGCVTSVVIHLFSGVPILDQAALDAVQRWRFKPARRAGISVTTEVMIPIRFTIEE